MNELSLPPFRLGRPITVTLLAALLLLASAPQADARRPMPMPTEPGVHQSCEIPVEPARSVQAAFEEHYECVTPLVDDWFAAHPEEVEQYEALYQAWRTGRAHDLRDRPEAARYVRQHPVDFSERSVELTSRQVNDLSPNISAMPAAVVGTFQRFFVDRDNSRLFLTSKERGLVSLAIGARYAFEVEGEVGEPGAKEFFVYDGITAFVEEDASNGAGRDLVVLDISDYSRPREITRLRGVLPAAQHTAHYLSSIPARAPSFEEYRLVQEGRMILAACGHPPTVSTHAGVHCRPDGSCFRHEHGQSSEEDAICTRQAVAPPQPQPTARSHRPMPTRSATASESMRMGPTSATPPTVDIVAESGSAPAEGGSGGAGSLSQMMVSGTTLYVLSAHPHQPRGWLTTFDVANPRQPRVSHLIALDNGPEALQLHDSLLLIAGRDAVITASLGAPNAPRLLGEFRQHCPVNYDPVVVQGSIAYRTIIVDHRAMNCTSRLEIIDLSQPHRPLLRNTVPIARPRGLAVLGGALFVADEHRGIQVFDLTDPVSPAHAATWAMSGVKDLVISDFDLYALSSNQVQTFFIGALFERGKAVKDVAPSLEGFTTVVSERDDS